MTAFTRMDKSELTIERTSLKGRPCYQSNHLPVAVWFDLARWRMEQCLKGLYNIPCRPTEDKLIHATGVLSALSFFFASLVRTHPLLFVFRSIMFYVPCPRVLSLSFCNKHAGVVPKHCHFNEHIRYLKWVKGESGMKRNVNREKRFRSNILCSERHHTGFCFHSNSIPRFFARSDFFIII